jgi:hypothetical protein
MARALPALWRVGLLRRRPGAYDPRRPGLHGGADRRGRCAGRRAHGNRHRRARSGARRGIGSRFGHAPGRRAGHGEEHLAPAGARCHGFGRRPLSAGHRRGIRRASARARRPSRHARSRPLRRLGHVIARDCRPSRLDRAGCVRHRFDPGSARSRRPRISWFGHTGTRWCPGRRAARKGAWRRGARRGACHQGRFPRRTAH